MKPHIIVVDDEPDIRELITDILRDEQFHVTAAACGTDALALLDDDAVAAPDAVVLDVWMPDMDGISVLSAIKQQSRYVDTPVIMVSGHGTIDTAVEATKKGAWDFVEKPLTIERLLMTINHALEARQLRRENQALRAHSAGYFTPVGRSEPQQQLQDACRKLAALPTPVLLVGPEGSGKKSFAQFIHACSPRADKPCLLLDSVQCDDRALLLETYEQCRNGTLVLTDIASLGDDAQTQCVRWLTQTTETRLLFTANVDSVSALQKIGALQMSFLSHLVPYALQTLPLTACIDDLELFINHFTSKVIALEGLSYRRFRTSALNRLRNYHWPGNMRELAQLVERLHVLGGGDDIDVDEIEPLLHSHVATPAPDVDEAIDYSLSLREARDQFERRYLTYHLRRLQGNISALSRVSGMERTSLHRKLKQLHIDSKSIE